MNRKSVIQTVVVVSCFAVAGIVLYNGYFKKNTPPPAMPILAQNGGVAGAEGSGAQPDATAATGTPAAGSRFLPYGKDVDNMFKVLNKQALRFGFKYPQVDLGGEVGKPEEQLLQPLPSSPNSR